MDCVAGRFGGGGSVALEWVVEFAWRVEIVPLTGPKPLGLSRVGAGPTALPARRFGPPRPRPEVWPRGRPAGTPGMNLGMMKSPIVGVGVMRRGGSGPFHMFFHGGRAVLDCDCDGAGIGALRSVELSACCLIGIACFWIGCFHDVCCRNGSAPCTGGSTSPKSSHSESESGSQNLPSLP